MLRLHRAALNPGASAGPLLGHQNPLPSRAAGSFPGCSGDDRHVRVSSGSRERASMLLPFTSLQKMAMAMT
jgi:hypothetical protein